MEEQRVDAAPEEQGSFASFETADGDLVIYDRGDPTSWYQSDTVTEIQDWR
jgi:hypothetical protein